MCDIQMQQTPLHIVSNRQNPAQAVVVAALLLAKGADLEAVDMVSVSLLITFFMHDIKNYKDIV